MSATVKIESDCRSSVISQQTLDGGAGVEEAGSTAVLPGEQRPASLRSVDDNRRTAREDEADRRKEQRYGYNNHGEDRVRRDFNGPVAKRAKKKRREPLELGWTPAAELVLVELAREFQPFKVADRKATVVEQWRLIGAKIHAERNGPIGSELAGVPTSRLRSHFAYMLKTRREMENNHVYWLASGGNGTPEQVEAKLGTADIVDAMHADLSAAVAKLKSKEAQKHDTENSEDSDDEDSDSEDSDSEDSDSDDSDIEDEVWKARVKASKLSRDKYYATARSSLCDFRAHERLIRKREREQYRFERWVRHEKTRGDSGSGDSDTEDEDAKARAKARKVERDLIFAQDGGDKMSKSDRRSLERLHNKFERGAKLHDRFRRQEEARKRRNRSRRAHEERKALAATRKRELQVVVQACKRED